MRTAALAFRAWDVSDGLANGGTGNASVNGGSSAFSQAMKIPGQDFRQIYAAVLDRWLGVPSRQVLGQDYQHPEIFRA